MAIRYPLAAGTFSSEEIDAAKAVLDSGKFTMGECVEEFQNQFAKWLGARHALMVNSGSSANLLMVDLMLRRSRGKAPWQPGDEVFVPGLSWSTTVWPLVQLGLKPVYVDVDPETLAIDIDSARSMLSPRSRGMVLIHVLGRVANMTAIRNFCSENGLDLLEDNCESLGAHFEGKAAGTFGVFGTFSSYFSHHLTTIEGGMVVTDSDELYDDLKSVRAHGWTRGRSDEKQWAADHPQLDSRFLFIMPGYNVRPTEIQAAIGLVQLKKLDQMLEARETLAGRVHTWIQDRSWISLLGAETLPTPGTTFPRRQRAHSWMNLVFRLGSHAPIQLDALKSLFHEHGVDTRPVIAGNLARHPASKLVDFRQAPSLKTCDALLEKGFMIGCHPVMSAEAMESLESAFQALRKI